MPTEITSRQNPLLKRVREALREHRDEIAIEGPKFVSDAIVAGWKPIVTFHRSRGPEVETVRGEFDVAAELFDSLAETKSPQNVIALFERPHFGLSAVLGPRSSESVVVALDGVQDPGNVGTIVRLAAAFDCAGVVLLPGSADAYSPKAIRASAGSVLSVPIVSAGVKDLLRSGPPIYFADARGETSDPPARNAILVFGSEGRGVSDAIRAVGTAVAIRTSGRVESLNVAASAAILLSRSFDGR